MKPYIRISHTVLITILTVLFSAAFSFEASAQKPETVHQLAFKGETFNFYKTQAEVWLKELDKDLSNEAAWYNYYKACRYSRMMFYSVYPDEASENWINKSKAFKKESNIIVLINTHVPNTFTAELLNSNESLFNGKVNKDRALHLFNAYKINPNHPEIQDEVVTHYEILQDLEKRKEHNQHWFQLNSLPSVYLNYAYNMFMSIDDDAILFTGGDADTYSAWMVQDVMGIGQNVTVINSSLICLPEYRAKVFSKLGIPEITKSFDKEESNTMDNQQAILKYIIAQLGDTRPIYTALTSHRELYQSMEDDFYLTGLARQYSKTNIDEIALLKRNFHKRFLVDYLRENFVYSIAEQNLNTISINYIPALLKLYMHYEISEEKESMEYIKSIIKQISIKASPEMLNWYNSTFEEKC